MSLLRRGTREVYRLYGEAEYLAGSERGWDEPAPDAGLAPHAGSAAAGELRVRRVLGVAVLLGATGAVATAVVLDGLSRPAVNTGRDGARARAKRSAPLAATSGRADAELAAAPAPTPTPIRRGGSRPRVAAASGASRRTRRASRRVTGATDRAPMTIATAASPPAERSSAVLQPARAQGQEFGFEQ